MFNNDYFYFIYQVKRIFLPFLLRIVFVSCVSQIVTRDTQIKDGRLHPIGQRVAQRIKLCVRINLDFLHNASQTCSNENVFKQRRTGQRVQFEEEETFCSQFWKKQIRIQEARDVSLQFSSDLQIPLYPSLVLLF